MRRAPKCRKNVSRGNSNSEDDAPFAGPTRSGPSDAQWSRTCLWRASGSLSDAVAADNFTVLHAKISKPFRDQFPPEKLQAVFKDLVDKHAVFDAVVARPIVADEEAKIDEKGVLRLKGHFETSPKQVKYQLGFIPSDGAWKLSGVTIDIE